MQHKKQNTNIDPNYKFVFYSPRLLEAAPHREGGDLCQQAWCDEVCNTWWLDCGVRFTI